MKDNLKMIYHIKEYIFIKKEIYLKGHLIVYPKNFENKSLITNLQLLII